LDEWLLFPHKETEARNLLEIIAARHNRGSTIFCSQFDIDGWYLKIGEPTLSEAVCDRIAHNSHTIVISGDSMRIHAGRSALIRNIQFIGVSSCLIM
jgi:DNA replication protein DnaC